MERNKEKHCWIYGLIPYIIAQIVKTYLSRDIKVCICYKKRNPKKEKKKKKYDYQL